MTGDDALERRALQRRQERAGIVARAAKALATARDSRQALVELTRGVVPDLADWCAIDELGPDGRIRRVALHHRDPEMLELAADLEREYPIDPHSPTGVPAVLRSGTREHVAQITDAMLVAGARDARHLELARALRLAWYAVVPMVARGGIVGALTIVGEGERAFSDEDLEAVEELARHAALALENARLIEAAEFERARMAALVEATATVVWSAGADGTVTAVSPSWLAFTGQSASDDVAAAFLEAIHPDERAATMRIWRAAVEARTPYAAEHRLRRADGSWAHTLARGMPVLDRSGAAVEYIGCNVDITGLRNAERAANEHAETLVALNELGRLISAELDQHKVVQAVIDAATSLTGAQLGSFAEGFRGDAIVRHGPMTSYLAVPVIARSGEVLGAIALGHEAPGVFDVRAETIAVGLAAQAAVALDNARLYGEARRLIRELEQSNRELDQFAYVASHDLKAPLRGISHVSEWIEDDLGPDVGEEMRRNMTLLRGRVRRLEALIDGILSYSRIGRTPEKLEVVDVQRLLVDTIEMLGVQPPATVTIGAGMPTLNTERTRLQQVFMNLIGNGLKHAQRADAEVRVSVRDTGGMWEFAIGDNGPGIPPPLQARVWGIFQTLRGRDQFESTGIGLAIVKKVVEARGGAATVESDGASGATFRFTWPKVERPQRSK